MKTAVLRWIRRRRYVVAISLTVILAYLILLRKPIFSDPLSTAVFDSRGDLLGARVAADGQWRFPAGPALPEKIRKATIAFEDRYFYLHAGFNPVSLVRALVLNIRAGHIVSGGSTITMQTIRLARKSKTRSLPEKCIEIILATRLELGASKDEILRLYTAHAPYGCNVVGINAAAWRYFGTACEDLSWAEAATLAVLPNAPSLVHPGRNRDRLREKRNKLLRRIHELDWIDKTTLNLACSEPIPEQPVIMPRRADHLLNRISRSGQGEYRTTLNGRLQDRVIEILNKHHKILQYNQIHNLSALIVDVETGNVLAYVGNTGGEISGEHGDAVDVIRSPRSTGSLLKPVLYAAMLDAGMLLPNSLVADIPMNLSGFAPRNFNDQYEGAVPAAKALSRSLNVPAVRMLRDYGTERFQRLLQDLGMTTLGKPSDHYGLSLILGGAEGTLEEIVSMYAGFSRVLNHYAKTHMYYASDFRKLNLDAGINKATSGGMKEFGKVSAAALWYTYLAMNEVSRPDEESSWRLFGRARKIAWKTGTSFGYRDGWAIGTSPEYVIGVWAGNADGEGRPGLTGISAAAPVLFELFGILPGSGWFSPPLDELIPATVCRESGYLAGPLCPGRDTVNIPLSGARSPACPFHHVIHLSADGKYRVNVSCCEASAMIHTSWFVLPPVQEWYYQKRHSEYHVMPPFRAGCEPANSISMDLIYPHENARIFVPVELGGDKGRVIFEAVHRDQDAEIFWHLDGVYVSCTRMIHQVEMDPGPGRHTLVLVDKKGEELVRHFTVPGRQGEQP